ncbi:NADH:flavin oxidoreductase/NADH oxidase family protein [uncultured Algimonas sp.]|uniref:NADH:flavin oxidoreductase/NADH oxidase family protein n=1 Tax=uncultured Algimonas sp. TaxID=1547920 RepID=UPI002637596F|nr:NADH:flavin oxidoreductase/NADH oxidase family protein [uncultured Algimonas sp.]
MSDLFAPLTLPCGHVLSNRIAKAAMEENMADQPPFADNNLPDGVGQVPGERLVNLYTEWADGGAGMLITGNVMVSETALTGPGAVVLRQGTLDEPDVRERFERWAQAGKRNGTTLLMQISHPGRQLYAAQGVEAVSASDSRLDMGSETLSKLFAPARALSGDEIRGIIRRFAETALAARSAGFDGVEIHAAHGYLLAQFLSPLTNRREDEWGGPLENRARLLLEIVRAVRDRVGTDFIVAVKLNSADFQTGGFDVSDAVQVVNWLGAEAVDFVEISGGTYESAAMMGDSQDGRISQSTVEREAFFLEFAKDIAATATMPLMVTGGITRRDTAERVVGTDGIELVGLARALIVTPDLPARWQAGEDIAGPVQTVGWKNAALRSLANMALAKANLRRMSRGQAPKRKINPVLASLVQQKNQALQTRRYKRWLEGFDR